jgi:hypothetical protein
MAPESVSELADTVAEIERRTEGRPTPKVAF